MVPPCVPPAFSQRLQIKQHCQPSVALETAVSNTVPLYPSRQFNLDCRLQSKSSACRPQPTSQRTSSFLLPLQLFDPETMTPTLANAAGRKQQSLLAERHHVCHPDSEHLYADKTHPDLPVLSAYLPSRRSGPSSNFSLKPMLQTMAPEQGLDSVHLLFGSTGCQRPQVSLHTLHQALHQALHKALHLVVVRTHFQALNVVEADLLHDALPERSTQFQTWQCPHV